MKSEGDFKSSFKYKDGMVMDHPWELLEFGVYVSEISPLLIGDGSFRGFVRHRYLGDGSDIPAQWTTKETYPTMQEAIIAAKIQASEKYGPSTGQR